MTSLSVPCILVDNTNLQTWWPHIIDTLSQCDILAIDLELSGLGSKDLFATQIDERYKALKEVASTRAILSMGLACFKINSEIGFFKRKKFNTNLDKAAYDQICDCIDSDLGSEDDEKESDENDDFHVTVTIFDFLCLSDKFVIETKSMKFLVQQGFDFNELARNGIPYCSGNDMKFEDSTFSLRSLLLQIIASQPTVIFHNGLLDLAFLYQNFYAELPNKLETFVSDIFEMFPKGIFDTKYVANSYLSNSYLEYLFNHSQRKNYFRKINTQPHINLIFDKSIDPDSSDIRFFDLSSKIFQVNLDNVKICDNYAKYGWCEMLDSCLYSHNIDIILDEELRSKKDRKTKILVNHLKSLASEVSKRDDSIPMRKSGSHHSGNDAFMTGYYFLFYLIINFNKHTFVEFKKFYENLSKFKNKIFLSGKVHPLNIMKSSFAATSKNHQEKLIKIEEIKEKEKGVNGLTE